jgi:hypothetical protein
MGTQIDRAVPSSVRVKRTAAPTRSFHGALLEKFFDRVNHDRLMGTYRSWNEPPLRSNKQVFRSKIFVAAHIGGGIAMIVACRNKNSGENWASEIPAVGAIFGMDYLQFRFIGGPNAIGPPIYEMIRYSQASTK